MDDVLSTIVVFGIGGVLFVLMQRQLDRRWEVSWLAFAFLTHLAAPFAQIAITRGVYGGGDMMMYHHSGTAVARVVRIDWERFFPELLNLIVHQRPAMPLHLLGIGGPTGSMIGLTALSSLATNDSIYATAIAFSLLSFTGTWAIYVVFRETFPASLRQRLVVTCMALPSVVFWTSAILKESVAVAGFGWVLFGTHRILRGRPLVGWPAILAGAALMAAVKPYVLVAYGASVAVYFYWRRAVQRGRTFRVRPVYLLLSAGFTVAVVLGLGEVFPQYAVSSLGEEAARLQTVGAGVAGGSNYSLAAGADRSLVGQLVFGPLALATTLFRPLPFEVSSGTMALNTVETTLLTGWLVSVLWRRRWADLWRITTSSPLLMFSVTFIVLFGVAVGLASTNLGSLSRYRAPLMPLFASLIAIWGGWRLEPATVPAPAPPAARPRPRARRRRPIPSPSEAT